MEETFGRDQGGDDRRKGLPGVDVEEFLVDLGMNNVHRRGKEVWYSCPFDGHTNSDRNPSASMNDATGAWHCFGCGRGGTQVEFLSELEGISPLVAISMIRERFGERAYREPDDLEERIRDLMKIDESHGLPELDEDESQKRLVDWATVRRALRKGRDLPWGKYALDRFPADVLSAWEFGIDEISGRLSFPYRDLDGTLRGFKGRAWWPCHDKYKVLGDVDGSDMGYGFPTLDVGEMVFGGHLVEASDEPIVVTEGELNSIAVSMHGCPRVVGISGKRLSTRQVEIISTLGSAAIPIFDSREDARIAVRALNARVPVFLPPEHDRDPCDMGEEVIGLIEKAVPSIGLTR